MENGTKKGGRKATLGIYIVVFLVAVTLIPAIVGFAIVGLGPTIVAGLANQHRYRFQHVFTIFSFNMVGMFVFLPEIALRPRNFGPVTDVLSSTYSYLIMYGAAGLGVVVLLAAPQVAAVGLQVTSVERLRRVKAAQENLITEWGKEVSGEQADKSE